MSESGDDSSDAGKKRSSFGFQFDKFQDRMSSKISNPFKKDKSDSDSDSGGKSPPKSTPSPVLESLKESSAPPVPPRPEVVQAEAVNNVLKVEDVPTAGAQAEVIPVAGEEGAAPSNESKPEPAATATPAVPAPAGTTALPPPKTADEAAAPATPAPRAAPAAPAAPSAVPAPEEVKSGEIAADAPADAPAAEVPRKEYKVVGGPVSGVAEIVVSGVKGDPEDAIMNMRRRGFVVHLAMLHDETVPPTMTMVLALGPKLQVKSAVERKLQVKPKDEYTCSEVAELLADSVDVIHRSGIHFDEVNLLHNKQSLIELAKAGAEDRADSVFSYFGPYFGLYFAWLRFYTRALAGPTVAGIILFASQWRSGISQDPLMPAFCVLLIVWTMGFVEMWKRQNTAISFKWGVDGVEDDDRMRAAARKAGQFKAGPAGKYCVTIPIILAAIYWCIRSMLYCIWLSDHAVEVYGQDSYRQYIPLLAYSIVPIVNGALYGVLAKALNNFEEHSTDVRKKNMLVIKMFAFQFINSYCALFYVAFWLKDLNRLRSLLTTMLMVKQFIAQLVEKYQPVVMRKLKDRKEKKNPPMEPRYIVKHTGTVSAEDVFDELKMDPASVESDYLEMVLQFGYLAMFGSVFPLAPLFAMLNNIWEVRLDLSMLLKTKRPPAHAESSIGAWQLCLEIIAVVACLTNLLMVVMSDNVSSYVPEKLSVHMGSTQGQVMLVLVVEHVLLLLRILVVGAADKVPKSIRDAQDEAAVEEKKGREDFRRRAAGHAPPKGRSQRVASQPSSRDKLRSLNTTYNVWNFGPIWYMPLSILPFLVAWLNLSPFFVLPIAFVFVSYLQHIHDKANSGLALGIVKDPQVLKMVTNFLPAWYTDSEVERVEWMNKIVGQMWVSASAATKDLCYTTIQPLLDSYRPPGISALGFKKVSLGTVPPKVVGIRALEMKGDKAVFDVEIRWASNAEIVLEAGVKPIPLMITLDKIRFSGKMRIELAPLVPVFPCFGAIVVTFMEKPFLDFAFSLGKMDVMSIGPGDANIGAAVSNMIKGILESMMVFPQRMVVPILEEQDIMDLQHPTPSGVLELKVVGADDLRKTDLTGKSDPYVKVKLGSEQEVKTDVIQNTLNPRWKQNFDLMVYERSVEIVKFTVYDRDPGPGDDDELGECELPLSLLQPDVQCAHNLVLSNTKSGSLLIKATYVPLVSGRKKSAIEAAEDEIVGADGDALTDDLVGNDAYPHLAEAKEGKDPGAVVAKPKKKRTEAVDPSTLPPQKMLSDSSMGVLSVMGIECKGVKKGDRYVAVVCGNTKRKTAIERGKTSFAYANVFHFLIRGAKSAMVEVLLMEDEKLVKDKIVGSVKIYVNEVIINEGQLDEERDFSGEKAQGTIKMRLKWAGKEQDDED